MVQPYVNNNISINNSSSGGFISRNASVWRPSSISVLSTTKARAAARTPSAQQGWASQGRFWIGDRLWRMFWQGRRPRPHPHSAWRRDRGRATRRTWRRSAAAQRALIRRWGRLLPPDQHLLCSMESCRSEGPPSPSPCPRPCPPLLHGSAAPAWLHEGPLTCPQVSLVYLGVSGKLKTRFSFYWFQVL